MSLVGTFVTPGDVDAKKRDLSTQIEAFDQVVASASGLAPSLVTEWGAWSRATRFFCASETGFWTAGGENDEVLSKEKEFNAWRTQLSAAMGVPAPPNVLPPAPPPLLEPTDNATKGLIALGLVALIVTAVRR